jgi:F-box and WD-40 domain protein CDC4
MDASPTDTEASAESTGFPSFASTTSGQSGALSPVTAAQHNIPVMDAAHGLESGANTAYAALGQLSYVPATHTTVVTTTTTTKIDFPPILMRAPRSLIERDPKIYPLASSPTPESVKRFTFDAGGTQAYFSEAEDVDRSLNDASPPLLFTCPPLRARLFGFHLC